MCFINRLDVIACPSAFRASLDRPLCLATFRLFSRLQSDTCGPSDVLPSTDSTLRSARLRSHFFVHQPPQVAAAARLFAYSFAEPSELTAGSIDLLLIIFPVAKIVRFQHVHRSSS